MQANTEFGALHPGRILKSSFLEPLGISLYRLAQAIGTSQTRLGEIVAGKRSVSADTALRLSKYFGLDERFWLQVQADYDLTVQKAKMSDALLSIKPYTPADSASHKRRRSLKAAQ